MMNKILALTRVSFSGFTKFKTTQNLLMINGHCCLEHDDEASVLGLIN